MFVSTALFARVCCWPALASQSTARANQCALFLEPAAHAPNPLLLVDSVSAGALLLMCKPALENR